MIDASRSPHPLWKRISVVLVLIAAIVGAAWLIWVKELHHSQPHIKVLAPIPAASALASSIP
jgi:hypothetical protein